MINIFVSPSQQPENHCKFGDTEQDHCRSMGNELIAILQRDNRFNSSISSIVSGTVPQKCWSVVYQSNDFINAGGGNGYHICIHTNAGGGKGCAGFYTGNGKGKKATRICLNKLNEISPWSEQEFRSYDELIEMNTVASTVYLEVNFHDNINQANWIHGNIKNVAIQTYKGLCEMEGIEVNNEAINPVVVVPEDTNKWKKEAIQSCIDLGLLTDTNWINKADESIPVFAVALMMLRLKTKMEESINKVIEDKFQNQTIEILKKK